MRIVVVVFDHEAVSSKLSKTVTLFTYSRKLVVLSYKL